MARLHKTPICEADLYAIWDHIAEDNRAAANRVLERLEGRFQLLVKFPNTGERQDKYHPGMRSVVEGQYIVFYEPTGQRYHCASCDSRRTTMGGPIAAVRVRPVLSTIAGNRVSVFMNPNRVITDRWSNDDSQRLYELHWPDEPALNQQHELGQQRGGCAVFAPFNYDWGLCRHAKSRHHLETVFERFTCGSYVNEGWEAHRFSEFDADSLFDQRPKDNGV
jgi:plasmid stabilization system protein ParE